MSAIATDSSDITTAEVVLGLPVRRRFHYLLPPEAADLVCRGSVVAVPFGGRYLTAYVLTVGPPPADAPADLKPLGEVLLSGAAVSDELIELAEFTADYYRASLGEVLRCALPVARVRSTRHVVLTDAGRDRLKGASLLAATDQRLLEVLAEKGPMTPAAAAVAAQVSSVAARLRRLQSDGLVAVATVVRRSAGEKTEEVLHLAEGADAIAREHEVLRRSPLARALYEVVRSGPARSWSAARTAAGASRSHLTRLVEAGLVEVRKEVVQRDLRASDRSSRRLSELELTELQQASVDAVTAAVERAGFSPFLLHGVTGAGKSLVYLGCIEKALELGRSALILVPEIALTPVFARELRGRFGDQVAVLHSALKPGERHDAWQRVRTGRARVVFGARLAVFAPAPKLGLIIVDEEHDGSYKQDERPHYNARDVAVARANLLGVPIVLGSATPSLESYRNASTGRYRLLELPQRVEGQTLPSVEIVDMRLEFEQQGREVLLSERLEEELRNRLSRGEQSVILLNRRGYASFLMCRECGTRAECPNCSVCVTYHRREGRLKCHQCDFRRPLPAACPVCEGRLLHLVGHGTEKVESAVAECVPDARIARLDCDAARGRDAIEGILTRFEGGELDILVGTQMVAKGHNFPRVTLVGVVSVDAMLALPDFRATERAFALLTQVAGRAGRSERPGHVLLQTFHPDNEAVKLACAQDYAGFFEREMHLRSLMRYPPAAHMANVIVRGREKAAAERDALAVKAVLSNSRERGIRVLGPAMAPIERRMGQYRAQLLLRSASRNALRRLLERAEPALEPFRTRGVLDLDVDPQDLM